MTLDGFELVCVPLTAELCAIVNREDFERIWTEGLSPYWSTQDDEHGSTYVAAHHYLFGKKVAVACMVMDAGCGDVVGYRSDNKFDLRKSNLSMSRRAPSCSPGFVLTGPKTNDMSGKAASHA